MRRGSFLVAMTIGALLLVLAVLMFAARPATLAKPMQLEANSPTIAISTAPTVDLTHVSLLSTLNTTSTLTETVYLPVVFNNYDPSDTPTPGDTTPPIPIADLVVFLYPDTQKWYSDATLSSVKGEWKTTYDAQSGLSGKAQLWAFRSEDDALNHRNPIFICDVDAIAQTKQGCYAAQTVLPLGQDYWFRVTLRDIAGNTSWSNTEKHHMETLGEYAVWHHLSPDTVQTLDYSGIYTDSLEGTAFILHDTWRLAGYLAVPYLDDDPDAQQQIYDILLTYVDGQGIAELTVDPDRASVLIMKPSPSGLNIVTMNLDLSDGRDADQIWFGYTDEEMDLIRGYLAEMMIPLIDSPENSPRYLELLPGPFWW